MKVPVDSLAEYVDTVLPWLAETRRKAKQDSHIEVEDRREAWVKTEKAVQNEIADAKRYIAALEETLAAIEPLKDIIY